jgi:hypothetical protein
MIHLLNLIGQTDCSLYILQSKLSSSQQAALNKVSTIHSEVLVAVGGTEGAQLHWSLGGHYLRRAVGSNVNPLGLFLLNLLLDPEVGEPQPILHIV